MTNQPFSPVAIPLALGFCLLVACGRVDDAQKGQADAFMDALRVHCGNAYEGRVVSTDAADADFASEILILHVRDCNPEAIRAPFHVGGDRSRTWVFTRTENGVRLKHDHRHEDGSEDAVTQYGGDSAIIEDGRAEFPADQYSIDLFRREGLDQSVANVWAVEISDDQFAYELSRENRFFRAEFDLTKPAQIPPAPWGAENAK